MLYDSASHTVSWIREYPMRWHVANQHPKREPTWSFMFGLGESQRGTPWVYIGFSVLKEKAYYNDCMFMLAS